MKKTAFHAEAVRRLSAHKRFELPLRLIERFRIRLAPYSERPPKSGWAGTETDVSVSEWTLYLALDRLDSARDLTDDGDVAILLHDLAHLILTPPGYSVNEPPEDWILMQYEILVRDQWVSSRRVRWCMDAYSDNVSMPLLEWEAGLGTATFDNYKHSNAWKNGIMRLRLLGLVDRNERLVERRRTLSWAKLLAHPELRPPDRNVAGFRWEREWWLTASEARAAEQRRVERARQRETEWYGQALSNNPAED